MDENLNNLPEQEENKQETAGWFGVICSFIMPIVGVILYFCQKDKVSNPDKYLHAALISFVISVVLNLLAAAI